MSEVKEQAIEPAFNRDGIILYHESCGVAIPLIKRDINLVLTDPPWMFHRYTANMTDAKFIRDDAEATWFKQLWLWYAAWLTLIRSKNIERAWYFVGWYQMAPFIRILTLLNFEPRHILMKPRHEYLIYLGPEPLDSDWITAIDKDFQLSPYNNRKDVAFLKKLIKATKLEPKSCILDPFSGEGSSLIAAHESGHHAIGIEVKKEYIESSKAHLAAIGP